jgi:hypothetical protein
VIGRHLVLADLELSCICRQFTNRKSEVELRRPLVPTSSLEIQRDSSMNHEPTMCPWQIVSMEGFNERTTASVPIKIVSTEGFTPSQCAEGVPVAATEDSLPPPPKLGFA